MNVLAESIKCTSCKEVLKLPVLLPCGHAICKHHETEADKTRQTECAICCDQYEIPVSGFVRARALENLLQAEIESLDLGDEYIAARDQLGSFGDLLEHFDRIKSDPEMRIHTVINEMRNKVDLRREELKGEIDRAALKMIEKLNEFEKECKLKTKSITPSSQLDRKLEKWKTDLKQWQQILSTFKKNMDKWKQIYTDSTSHLKDLQSELCKLNNVLFLNRINDFKFRHILNSTDFDSISVEVKGLSKCKFIKDDKALIDYDVTSVGIHWSLSISILNNEKTNAKYVTAFFLPVKYPLIQDMMIDYDIGIVDQLGMDKSLVKSFDKCRFDQKNNWKETNLIDLKDLLNNYNLYSISDDSCTIQVKIKKIETI